MAIKEHNDWMRKTNFLEAGEGIYLADYYMAKVDDLNNVADPIQETTGDILYSINETHIQLNRIDKHMK